ncbi:MAG TPA: UDP-N-acetylmuramate--L-alanine ligase, partial [Lutibacter sp.]|nr:UDP-N-acetylmuramate--L-alanine ligase [Lutibacter sp.]
FFRQVVDKSGWFGQKLEIGKTPQQGEYNEAIIIDDYAHHPTEVKAALQATKEKYPTKNIKCIFHPHTFTRTETLLNDFAKSFNDADEIYLLDIFGSAREKQGGVTSDNLVEKIKLQEQDKTVKNLHTIPEATKYFQQNLQPNDILITMGAGDVYLVGENLLKEKE